MRRKATAVPSAATPLDHHSDSSSLAVDTGINHPTGPLNWGGGTSGTGSCNSYGRKSRRTATAVAAEAVKNDGDKVVNARKVWRQQKKKTINLPSGAN